MKGSRTLLIALMSGSLLACRPATEEDRKALVGLWMPMTAHAIRSFKENGCSFRLRCGSPSNVLRIKWS